MTEVDRAVAAAKQAFDAYARWPVDARVALLSRVLDIYRRRYDEVAQTISQEMGAPIAFARAMQAAVGTRTSSRRSARCSRSALRRRPIRCSSRTSRSAFAR